jgi:hypothetical protein
MHEFIRDGIIHAAIGLAAETRRLTKTWQRSDTLMMARIGHAIPSGKSSARVTVAGQRHMFRLTA